MCRKRLRFSLRRFLLAVGVACLLVSNAVALRELARLRGENLRLRRELGYLIIENPARLHVVAAPHLEERSWQWRVYVPRQGRFGLFVAWEPSLVASAENASRPIDYSYVLTPGESTLHVRLRRNAQGQWVLRADGPHGKTVIVALESVSGRALGVVHQGAVGDTAMLESRERIVLLEDTDPEATLFGGTTDQTSRGLRLWLEELPERPPVNP